VGDPREAQARADAEVLVEQAQIAGA
jgi:hypothetical protein